MSDNEMLKPCPFCGGEAELITKAPEAYVHCLACSATSDSSFVPGHAAKQWNRRAAASAEPVAWQPIETAPMDGTDVLIAAYGRAAEAWYSDSSHRWLWANGEPVLMTVTHWMPLPKGPANE